ncbi:hypothetical protein [Spiroplasma endosymbiont of Labia minor]|uniref:hypothetical protein n=1 Tax=Spiroplasma endosymbiont of Labia minor TaxID=3066305 RepID=UPI0030D3F53F
MSAIALTVVLFTTQFKISSNTIADNPTKINDYNFQSTITTNVLNKSQRWYVQNVEYQNIRENSEFSDLFDSTYFVNAGTFPQLQTKLTNTLRENLTNLKNKYISGNDIANMAMFYQDYFLQNESLNNNDNLTGIVLTYMKNIAINYLEYFDLEKLKNINITFYKNYILPENSNQDGISFASYTSYVMFENGNISRFQLNGYDDVNPTKLKLPETKYENAFYLYKDKNNEIEKILNVDVSYLWWKINPNLRVGAILDLVKSDIFSDVPSNFNLKFRVNSINKENLTIIEAYTNKKAIFELIHDNGYLDEDIYKTMIDLNFLNVNNTLQFDNENVKYVNNFAIGSKYNDGFIFENWISQSGQNGNFSFINFAM